MYSSLHIRKHFPPTGITPSGGVGFEEVDADDCVTMVQLAIQKCLEKEALCNEFYLQLIKQTTDQPGTRSATCKYLSVDSGIVIGITFTSSLLLLPPSLSSLLLPFPLSPLPPSFSPPPPPFSFLPSSLPSRSQRSYQHSELAATLLNCGCGGPSKSCHSQLPPSSPSPLCH